jgi:hypothetical protein
MIKALISWTILVLMILSVPVAAADVSGDWQVDGAFDEASRSSGAVGGVDLICRLKQDAEKLTGRCGPDLDSGAPVSGDVQGQNIVWRFEIALQPDGPQHVVTFKATLDDRAATMHGTFAVAEFQGRFSAKRQ